MVVEKMITVSGVVMRFICLCLLSLFFCSGTLQSVFDEVKEVNILDSGDTENLRLLARPELGITFTKFHCWKLTQFEKCVFLDADTLVLPVLFSFLITTYYANFGELQRAEEYNCINTKLNDCLTLTYLYIIVYEMKKKT